MNKNNTKKTANTLLECDEAVNIIKKSSHNILETLFKEGIKNYMNESIMEAEKDEDDNEFEVEEPEVGTTDDAEASEANDEVADETEEAPEEEDIEVDDVVDGDGDEWAAFDEFKVGDDEYDLSNVQDNEKVVKIWKLLGDDDAVGFNKVGNTVEISDNETGAEYKIEMPEEGVEGEDFEDDSLETGDEPMFEIDLSKLGNILNEDFGYTDNYQNKDVMTNNGMTEPAKPGPTRTIDKGVPTGTEKPWAGDIKGKGDPFDETVNETTEEDDAETIDEITTVTSNNARKVPKTHTSVPREEHLPYGSKHISVGSEYKENIKEAILKKVKMIEEENKAMKKALPQFKKAITEAALVNVNLGRIVNILVENTTSKKEKADIVERFSKTKNFKESEQLYETISRELKKGQQKAVVLEKTLSTGSMINEKTVYQDPEVTKAIDLINRMQKL